MHIKRKNAPNFWPIARTGTKYMAVPQHNKDKAVSLVMFIRDVLGLTKNMKETEKVLREKKINVNGKIVIQPNYPLMFGDSLSIPSLKKYFRVSLNGRRFALVEISEKESESKVYRLIGKKIMTGKKIQLNFDNGKNIISNEKIKTGDFALINSSNKLVKIMPMEKGIEIMIVKGKHIGKEGKITDIGKEGENIIANIKTKTEEIKVNIDGVYAKQ